jgi:hypothetical protein
MDTGESLHFLLVSREILSRAAGSV